MVVSYQARVVFPVDRPPIDHGYVTIDGPRIVAVGSAAASGAVIDLGPMALLPGLVNAHTHLEFSGLRQPLGVPAMPLADWIRLVIAERGRRGATADTATIAGLRESLQCGVTCIGDITTAATARSTDTPVHNFRNDAQERPSQLLSDGQECASYVVIDATHFAEVIGFSRARADSAYAAGIRQLDEMSNAIGGSHLGLSPHAPYTVSPALVARLVALARERSLPVAMHLAESTDEIEFLRGGTGRFRKLLEERSMWDAGAVPSHSRPLDYLLLLAAAPRSLVIHGNYLDAEERAFLAAHRAQMSLVYCPRTHAYFDHTPYPLAELLSAGLRVALGTDSRASNPDLDLWAEMQHVARTHPDVDPYVILRLGTLSGAEALGRDGELGSITPGKLANLLALPLATQIPAPRELLSHLLFAHNSATRLVWLRGKRITVPPDFA